jgi:hypothetical protein
MAATTAFSNDMVSASSREALTVTPR